MASAEASTSAPEGESVIATHLTQDSLDPAFRLPVATDQLPAHAQPPQETSVERAFEAQQSVGKVKKKAQQVPRLSKACDSCSKRKVKCDEGGPPCQHCKEVGIPCTFSRPSRRRGPRNRHADAIKEQLANGQAGSGPASPTYAAQTLASLAQQPILSADSICPAALLERFVDDYFTYIHPLVPVPHEPSFRTALAARADVNNPTFLALLASMVGFLVASFPRRPRLHILDLHMESLIPNSNNLLERCRRTAIEARGLAYLDRQQTIDDAIIAYLQGMIGAYSFNWDACRLYLGQCVSISRVIGLHRQEGLGSVPPTSTNGSEAIAPQQGVDAVLQEISRRMFWTLHSTITALQQLGIPIRELNMPPPTNSEPYPDLPMEIDDRYIIPQGVRPAPHGEISRLVGFNAISKVYKSCTDVCSMDVAYGSNELFDWANQRQVLQQSINTVKDALRGLPSELLFTQEPSSVPAAQPQQNHPPPTHGYPILNGGRVFMQTESEHQQIQYEIQKLNLTAAEIATRSFLIEKYSVLSDKAQSYEKQAHGDSDGQDNMDEMREDRDAMIKDFLRMIRDLDLMYFDASGLGFTNKLRQVVSTLVNIPPHRKSDLHHRVQQYLLSLVDFLSETQRIGPRGGLEGGDEDGVRGSQWAEMLRAMGEYV